MEKSEIRIRTAMESDAEKLLAIYAPYVEKTAITFEYEVPSAGEFAGRIAHVLKRYPYLVAERDGEAIGYAYVSPFHERAAYDWAVETSIYLRQDMKRMGIGSTLYTELEEILRRMNILNLNACIAYPETEDEYLTRASVKFHQKSGYNMVGEFHQCGYKFGRWYNMVWMEKIIGMHLEHQPAVIPFSEL
ncbi:MAG: GNAT family N-acetyltransferase [Butyrivibrio sp.]|jgi:phosphinothricin acetyltransferase|nr:GNAT family N-acetyltransferase [Butyrivibrio sp.]